MSEDDPYKTLGITPNATIVDIVQAYKDLCSIHKSEEPQLLSSWRIEVIKQVQTKYDEEISGLESVYGVAGGVTDGVTDQQKATIDQITKDCIALIENEVQDELGFSYADKSGDNFSTLNTNEITLLRSIEEKHFKDKHEKIFAVISGKHKDKWIKDEIDVIVEEKIQDIEAAYQLLIDPKRREKWNATYLGSKSQQAFNEAVESGEWRESLLNYSREESLLKHSPKFMGEFRSGIDSIYWRDKPSYFINSLLNKGAERSEVREAIADFSELIDFSYSLVGDAKYWPDHFIKDVYEWTNDCIRAGDLAKCVEKNKNKNPHHLLQVIRRLKSFKDLHQQEREQPDLKFSNVTHACRRLRANHHIFIKFLCIRTLNLWALDYLEIELLTTIPSEWQNLLVSVTRELRSLCDKEKQVMEKDIEKDSGLEPLKPFYLQFYEKEIDLIFQRQTNIIENTSVNRDSFNSPNRVNARVGGFNNGGFNNVGTNSNPAAITVHSDALPSKSNTSTTTAAFIKENSILFSIITSVTLSLVVGLIILYIWQKRTKIKSKPKPQ